MIRIARMAAGYGMPVPDDMESNNGVTQVLAGILGVAPPGR